MWRGDRPLLIPDEPGATAEPDEPMAHQHLVRRNPLRRIATPLRQPIHALAQPSSGSNRALVWRPGSLLQTLTAATIPPPSWTLAGDANQARSQAHRQKSDRAPEPGRQAQYRRSQQGGVGS